MQEIQEHKPDLHVLVCCNDRDGKSPSCSPKVTVEMAKEVKMWIREQGWTGKVQCTITKCLGHCNPDGGVAMVYPTKRIVKGIVKTQEIQQILCEEKEKLGF